MAKGDEQGGPGVVARSAAIMRALASSQDGFSLGQIAKQVGMARSTVQRLVYALESEGLVMSGAAAGQITLGPEVLRLASSMMPSLATRVRPVMTKLSEQTQETVDLATIRRRGVLFIDQIPGQHRLAAVSHVGDQFPLHCSSVGKAFLARMKRGEIEAMIGTSYERRTPHTLTEIDPLLASLDQTAQTGFGFDEEEHSEGICAIGFVLRDASNHWYGLSIPVPLQRYMATRDHLIAMLSMARDELSQSLRSDPS